MRTIKFRGKRIDNGEWVYGYYVGKGVIIPFDKVNYDLGYINDSECHYCEPNTIGQLTGVLDKNGKDIYEGDIVQSKLKRARKYDEILQICFGDSEYYGKNKYGIRISLSILEDYHTLEIIGNIHDNPELINGNYKEDMSKAEIKI